LAGVLNSVIRFSSENFFGPAHTKARSSEIQNITAEWRPGLWPQGGGRLRWIISVSAIAWHPGVDFNGKVPIVLFPRHREALPRKGWGAVTRHRRNVNLSVCAARHSSPGFPRRAPGEAHPLSLGSAWFDAVVPGFASKQDLAADVF